jgi:translation initiation factor IF-2
MEEEEVGVVTQYFDRIGVAGISLTNGGLKLGDHIVFRGPSSQTEQVVESMQIDREAVTEAVRGQKVGVMVAGPVRLHDRVFRLR